MTHTQKSPDFCRFKVLAVEDWGHCSFWWEQDLNSRVHCTYHWVQGQVSCVTGRSNWTENAHYRKIFIAFYLFKATTLFWQLELPSLDPVSGCEGGSGFWQAIRTQVELACGPQEPPGLWTPTASWPGLNGDLANPPWDSSGKKNHVLSWKK